jgi:hypothetical protein
MVIDDARDFSNALSSLPSHNGPSSGGSSSQSSSNSSPQQPPLSLPSNMLQMLDRMLHNASQGSQALDGVKMRVPTISPGPAGQQSSGIIPPPPGSTTVGGGSSESRNSTNYSTSSHQTSPVLVQGGPATNLKQEGKSSRATAGGIKSDNSGPIESKAQAEANIISQMDSVSGSGGGGNLLPHQIPPTSSSGEGQRCLGCKATSTPEWRRGPLGPRTLCNACGLVYAKIIKRRVKEQVGNAGPVVIGNGSGSSTGGGGTKNGKEKAGQGQGQTRSSDGVNVEGQTQGRSSTNTNAYPAPPPQQQPQQQHHHQLPRAHQIHGRPDYSQQQQQQHSNSRSRQNVYPHHTQQKYQGGGRSPGDLDSEDDVNMENDELDEEEDEVDYQRPPHQGGAFGIINVPMGVENGR